MAKPMTFLAFSLAITLGSSLASAAEQKPAAKVSKISFLAKHRSPEQHKDRLSHGRK
jgi:hypothetical protein